MKKTSKQAYKTNWDLGLLFSGENDPRIEKGLKAVEDFSTAFEKKYRGKPFTKSPKALKVPLDEYIDFEKKNSMAEKAICYFYYRKHLDSDDNIASAFMTKIGNRMTLAGNKVAFFYIEISKIPASRQKIFLNDRGLSAYRYMLKKMFDNAKYLLSEKEEQLTSLLSNTSYSMWIDGQEKLLNQQVVEYRGEKIPIPKAQSMLSELPKKDRRELHTRLNNVYKSVSHFAEAEINAIYNFKKVIDERRGMKEPYSGTVLSYENDEKTVEMLVKIVTENFKISQRFYKLHAKLLGEKIITMADRNTKIGKIEKKFDFKTSVDIVGRIFTSIGPKYGDIFNQILNNGQVDVFPKKGKQGGAYCSSGYDMPTFLLLNHVDELRSLETLAHEMGHAVHAELSKDQPIMYQGQTISTAEVASTFFEQVVMSEIESHLSVDDKIILLHNRILGDISTIFVQITCFNFELELHKKIRKEGQLPKEEIAKLLNKHRKAYLGEVVKVTDDDGYFFVNWSHIRRFFYVYSYAYGQIISRALFENWMKDKSYIKKVEQFLSAGCSDSPENIFKKAGIDSSNPKFFEAGLKSIERDIDELEKLTKNWKTKAK